MKNLYNFNQVYILNVPIMILPDEESYALSLAEDPFYDYLIRELNHTNNRNILIAFAFGSMDDFHALSVDYCSLTKDFTDYINHCVCGETMAENNFYAKLIAKKCTPSILKNLNIFVDKLRALYPSKVFNSIYIFEQGGQHSECVSYLMNIGDSEYTPVYCNVMDCDGHDPMPLDSNPKIAYQQCLDTLDRINYSILGQKIFLVFTFDGYYDDFRNLEDEDALGYYDTFRRELSDYVNYILYDVPLNGKNHFDQANVAWYTLPTKVTRNPEYWGPINEYTTYGRRLIDDYVNKLKINFPEKEFKYIVLPSNYVYTSIIFNLPSIESKHMDRYKMWIFKKLFQEFIVNQSNITTPKPEELVVQNMLPSATRQSMHKFNPMHNYQNLLLKRDISFRHPASAG